jgi:DNA-binding transcriptional MerR regulator
MDIETSTPEESPDITPLSYSIRDLAEEFQLTTRSIRFYEDNALLSPERKGQNRIYSARDRVRLNLIVRGKRLGFSLREIKDMLDLYEAPEGEVGQLQHFIEKMRARREALLHQRYDINRVIEELESLESRCTQILADRDRE